MKRILIILFFYLPVVAMEKPSIGHVYHVPAEVNKTFHDTTEQDLQKILPDHLLQDEGWIEAIIVRPEKEMRAYQNMCEITETHIIGDKNAKVTEDKDLATVTIIRADVSQAIGGFHVPGDNIHVRGMRMGKQYLEDGDIIVIENDQDGEEIILGKTKVPHQACVKFMYRSGKKALEACNNEGDYENGFEGIYGKLNGVEQRLRGLRLAVLKRGKARVGSRVFIERGEAKERRLAKYGLTQKAIEMLQKSIEPGAKYELQDARSAQVRKDAWHKKRAAEDAKKVAEENANKNAKPGWGNCDIV